MCEEDSNFEMKPVRVDGDLRELSEIKCIRSSR